MVPVVHLQGGHQNLKGLERYDSQEWHERLRKESLRARKGEVKEEAT